MTHPPYDPNQPPHTGQWQQPYPPQCPHSYGHPQGHGYPTPPQQPPKPRPWHHYVTWPVVALTALAEVYTETARIADFQSVIIFAYVCVIASIASLVVTIRARHGWTIFFSVLSLAVALYLLGAGYDAMEQFEQILDDTLRDLNNLGY